MNIIGHTHTQKHLKQRFEGETFPQSLLFVGPESVGKFAVAFELAKDLVGATAFEITPGAPTPQDILVIEPQTQETKGAVKESQIKVAAIRQARDFLSQYPSAGKYRVVVIRDAHWLSEEAQNALLKTLEEPNTSSVLILVTHAPEQLLETVRSRLVHEVFPLVAETDIEEAFPDQVLEQADIPIFFRSFGRPGVLIRALEEPAAFQAEKKALTQLYRLSLLSVAERLKLAEELSQNIPQTKRILSWWLPGLYERAKQETELKRISQYFTVLTEINRVLTLLKTTNANSRLLLEQLFLAL